MFFWAPYYFAVTRHSELLWYEGAEAELKLAGKADLLLIKLALALTLTLTLILTLTLTRQGRPATDQGHHARQARLQPYP